jgi:cytochrome P450/NADPH-cytochrome P450 reductase
MSIPIPQPPTIPFIGNVTSLEKDVPLRSFHLLAETYGEIYQLNILGDPYATQFSVAIDYFTQGALLSSFRRMSWGTKFLMKPGLRDALPVG